MDLSRGFRIGDWEVRPLEGRIVGVTGPDVAVEGQVRHVRRKAMDVLCTLAAHAGQVVERDDILSAVWGRTAVTDEPLTSTIGELRRLLGERQGDGQRYIETIPKRGYRLLMPVQALPPRQAAQDPPPPSAEPSAARLAPHIHPQWRAIAVVLSVAIVVAVLIVQRLDTSGVPAVPPHSIAVLPFEDLSTDGDQGYFADGLADELISLLTGVGQLRVAARNSAFAFRDSTLDQGQIAEQLRVAHVLTGSVRHAGGQVRISTQLTDAREGYQLWAATYERTLEDIFAIQEEIAAEVARQLRVQLLGTPQRRHETDLRAYTLYLQARHIGHQNTPESLPRAVELFRQALAIDAGYVPAWSELAVVYFNLVGFALMPRDEGYALAREAALTALSIDPDHGPAHDRLAWLALHQDNDLQAAARHHRRALELAPDDPSILGNAALFAVALGRMDDAISMLQEVAMRDPVSAISHANLANAYLLSRRYPEAERAIRDALTLSPQYAGAHYRLARILLAQNDLEGAAAVLQDEPLEAGRLLGGALLANAVDDDGSSDAALAELMAQYGDRAAGNYAQVYAHRGDIDKAFEWLEVEYRVNGAGGFLEHRWEPLFDRLRPDPRWPALLERAGFGDVAIANVQFPVFSTE